MASKRKDADDRRRRDAEALTKAKDLLGRAEKRHQKRCDGYKRRHDVYLGKMNDVDKARWTRPIAPKYAMQSTEVLVSNLISTFDQGGVRPIGKDDIESAKLFEQILGVFRVRDGRPQKDKRWVRETAIMGVGPLKVLWNNEVREGQARTVWSKDPTGMYEQQTLYEDRVVHDESSVSPLCAYDWMPDPSASRLDEAGFVVATYWPSMDTLKAMERRELEDGSFRGTYRNLADVSESRTPDTDQKRSGRDHGDAVEVHEVWTPTRNIVMANRSTIIYDGPNQHEHGMIPFVCATTIPDLYTMDGLSVCEVIGGLQDAAWEVINDLLEAVRVGSQLLIKRVRDARISDDALELTSGNVIDVDDLNDLDFWHAGARILEPGLSTLEMLKTTMQETSGANAYLAGGASETIDQTTATGISIIQSMAQKLVQMWKESIDEERVKAGRMEIADTQQLMTRSEAIRIEPKAGEDPTFVDAFPWDILGQYDYAATSENQSLNEAQMRTEATLVFDRLVALSQDPNLAANGLQIQIEQVVQDLLESFGRRNTEAYIGPIPPPPMPQIGALPGGAFGASAPPGTSMLPAGAGAGAGQTAPMWLVGGG